MADKAESQEICFVGKGSYADFVAKRRPDVTAPGEIVDAGGEVLGEHRGLVHHTIGQRKGITIPHRQSQPLYVLKLEPDRNRLVVGSRTEAEAKVVIAEAVTMTDERWAHEPIECDAVVRYRGAPSPARVVLGSQKSREATIEFTSEERPVAAPGQAVVFYRGDEVLGGGTIRAVRR